MVIIKVLRNGQNWAKKLFSSFCEFLCLCTPTPHELRPKILLNERPN